eukprot:TRINITY_DN1381_c0_g1_i7.p2 TRINITY_DN1381_c0_g1~~TRINITY_DN1381_c0_g1_i7.p2  ORF type:complete len:157 (+),score=33.40 TRINITY_DN1381_c0_g1_i7:95-565(+)
MDGVASSAFTFVASPSVVTSHTGPAAALPRPAVEATGFGATISSVGAKTAGLTAAIATLAVAGRSVRRQQRQAKGVRGERPRPIREAGRQQNVMARLCKGSEDVGADEEGGVAAPECLGRDLVEEADRTGGKNRREAVANALAFLGFSWRKHPEAR